MVKRCAHCGDGTAGRTWDMRPCAIGKRLTYRLCDTCDVELNRLVLAFFKVARRDELMAEYVTNDD